MNTERIKVWLKESGHDRSWLASRCSVSKSTVDGWMAGRPIPKPSQGIITGLMYDEKPLAPRFTMEQYSKIQKAAAAEGMAVDAWIEKTILGSLRLLLIGLTAFHVARTPADWSRSALIATGKAAVSLCASLIS